MAIQWSLVLFTVLTGAAGWMFACTAWDKFAGKNGEAAFSTSIVALIVMIVGGCASVTHLAHPENIMEALNRPASGIFIEAALVGLSAVCIFIFAILVKRGAQEGVQKAFALLGAIFGILLSFMAGHSYMMEAIPAWNNWLLPLGYLGTAIPSGAALYLCFVAKDATADSVKNGANLLLIGGIVGAVLALAWGAASGSFATAGAPIALATVCDIVAAICGYLVKKHPDKTMTYAVVALIFALVGSIAFRVAMWMGYVLAAIGAPFITNLSTL